LTLLLLLQLGRQVCLLQLQQKHPVPLVARRRQQHPL
jgi:hypothetical protein